MASNAEVRKAVEDAVEWAIQTSDDEQRLRSRDYDTILAEVADDVFTNRLLADMRPELERSDHEFIESRVGQLVTEYLAKPFKARFERFDRVVCKIGGEHGWAPGTIQALNEEDPQDPTTKLPYVVKLDPPLARLISVPFDENTICRAEICFGLASKGDLGFTLLCKPRKSKAGKRRFGVGDRVACAVEDATGEYTCWDAGTVVDVDYNVEPDAMEVRLTGWDWSAGVGIVPYRVLLDRGSQYSQHVYVHSDVHWLIRELALQPAGPRQAESGWRDLKRLVKRRRGDAEWELIDHETRRVRIQAAGGTDDDDDSDEL